MEFIFKIRTRIRGRTKLEDLCKQKIPLSALDGWLVGDGVGSSEIHVSNGIASKENCYTLCVEKK